jgi:hypothetical protein
VRQESWRRLWEDLSTADFLLDFHQAGLEGKWWGAIQLASFLNLATLEELVFLHYKY